MDSSLFVLGGGGFFQDLHKFTLPALYRFNSDEISVYARQWSMIRGQLQVDTGLSRLWPIAN